MKRPMLLGGAMCAVALAVCATRALSQEEGKKAPDDPGAAMMEAWMKAGTPGEHHQHLEPYVGRWNATVRWRVGPERIGRAWGSSDGGSRAGSSKRWITP